MKQLVTQGIVLGRTNYGEADRIITVLTPEHGKLRLMARGVRKSQSKLAGGIELFSISDLTYIKGRGEIGTLISSRLKKHYGDIIKDIERVQLGYELIKQLNKATEDQPEPEYFTLLDQALDCLNDSTITPELTTIWVQAQLLKLAGHTPNLRQDTAGDELAAKTTYNFDFEDMAFAPHEQGRLTADHIKALRLLFGHNHPRALSNVAGLSGLLPDLQPIMRTMLTSYVRV